MSDQELEKRRSSLKIDPLNHTLYVPLKSDHRNMLSDDSEVDENSSIDDIFEEDMVSHCIRCLK